MRTTACSILLACGLVAACAGPSPEPASPAAAAAPEVGLPDPVGLYRITLSSPVLPDSRQTLRIWGRPGAYRAEQRGAGGSLEFSSVSWQGDVLVLTGQNRYGHAEMRLRFEGNSVTGSWSYQGSDGRGSGTLRGSR